MFFVNIASPARIVAIDARDPTKISTEYEILGSRTARTRCACDAGALP